MPSGSLPICRDIGYDEEIMSTTDEKKMSTDSSSEKVPETSVKINGGVWMPLLLGVLMLLAVFVPYFIAISRNDRIKPFLPFISDAAGSPPQCGIFSILLSLSSGVGFLSLVMRYMMVVVMNRPYRKRVDYLNKVSVLFALGSLGGMIMVGGYPVNYDRDKPTWILEVLLPHMIGAVMLFGSGVVFGYIQCIITYYVLPSFRGLLALRVILLLVCSISQICVVATFKQALNVDIFNTTVLEFILNHKVLEQQGLTPLEPPPWAFPLNYNRYYMISSVSEWLMSISFIAFFITFIPEARVFSIRLSLFQSKPLSSTSVLEKYRPSNSNDALSSN